MRAAVPILFGHRLLPPESTKDRVRLGSGVVVLLEKHKTCFLITAAHVARRAQIESRDSRVVCVVPGAEVPFHWAAIDDTRDLATVPLTAEHLQQIEGQGYVIVRPQAWPTVLPESDELVDYAGFPKALVRATDEPTAERSTLHLRTVGFASPVSSVVADGTIFTNFHSFNCSNPGMREIEPDGMSGGPAFVYRILESSGTEIQIPFLVGVVREGKWIGDVLSTVFSPVAAIAEDGRIVDGLCKPGRLTMPPH